MKPATSRRIAAESAVVDALETLNFEAGNFLRGSLATYTRFDGTIQRASGHQLRYMGATDGRRMALLEGERTNQVLRSEELNRFPEWFVPDFIPNAGHLADFSFAIDRLGDEDAWL